MSNLLLPRPQPDEFASYFKVYIDLVDEADVLAAMAAQNTSRRELLGGLDEQRWEHRYADRKWSIKEVLGHVMDAERIFATRALRAARGDETPMPGFEQDPYVAAARFERRSGAQLLDEMELVRRGSLALFEAFDEVELDRQATAEGKVFSVRAVAFLLVGHERHHLGVVRERYL